jgi:hypothetical protein
VLHRQLDYDIGAIDWVRIAAGAGVPASLAAARNALAGP